MGCQELTQVGLGPKHYTECRERTRQWVFRVLVSIKKSASWSLVFMSDPFSASISVFFLSLGLFKNTKMGCELGDTVQSSGIFGLCSQQCSESQCCICFPPTLPCVVPEHHCVCHPLNNSNATTKGLRI